MYFGQGDKMTFEEKAEQITEHMVVNEEDRVKCFDPMLIIAIISILIQLFKLWKDCNKTVDEAVEDMINPSIVTRVIVRHVSRNILNNDFNEFVNKVPKAIFAVGINTNSLEISEMFNEVGV